MNMRHELMGRKVELSRNYKKSKIIADAVAVHILSLLSSMAYEEMDIEDLQLSAQSLSEAVADMRLISKNLAKVNAALGN